MEIDLHFKEILLTFLSHIIYTNSMGCQAPGIYEEKKTKNSDNRKVESRIGVFQIKIKSIFLHTTMQGTETAQNQNLRLEVANQSQEFTVDQICLTPGQETMVKFYVNSSEKKYGRILTIEIWNERESCGKMCVGIFDLQPFIIPHGRKEINLHLNKPETKCYLNCDNSPAGFIEIQPRFHIEPFKEISLQFRSFRLIKQFGVFKNYFARVTIGSERIDSQILKVEKKADQTINFSKNSPLMNFKIPQSLRKGQICLMSKLQKSEKFLGSAEFQIGELSNEAELIDSQLFIDENNKPIGSISLMSIPTMRAINSTCNSNDENWRKPNPNKRTSIQKILLPSEGIIKFDEQVEIPSKKTLKADQFLFKPPVELKKRKSSAQI